MRVLLVDHGYGGGASQVLSQLHTGLQGRGVGSYLYGAAGGDPSRILGKNTGEEYPIYPDIVVCNTLLTWKTVVNCSERRIPVIWWIHEGEWAKRVLWNKGMHIALQNASRVVVSTKYMSELYCTKDIIKYATPITESPAVRVEGPLRFLMAGTIEWRKGFLKGLQAFLKAQEKYPDIRLSIIGGGWETTYGQEVAELACKGEGVDLYILKDITCFKKFLAKHDILLCPSEDEGGYPQVLLQAQEMGKGVVASDICGVWEQVHHGETGMRVDPLSIRDWIERIETCIQYPEKIKQMGKLAREFVHSNNNLETHLDEWQKLLERVYEQ